MKVVGRKTIKGNYKMKSDWSKRKIKVINIEKQRINYMCRSGLASYNIM